MTISQKIDILKLFKIHNFKFSQKYFFALLLLLISLISITWFRGDFQIVAGDFSFPPGRIAEFQRVIHSWDHFSLGSANFRILGAIVPYGIYLALTQALGISLVIAEKIWLYFLFASMGLSMYFLTITVVEENYRYLAGFLAALLFMFNPWTAINYTMVWPYIVFLPLILGLYIKGLNEKRGFKYIFVFCLLWIVTSTVSLINIRAGLHQWMTLFIYFIFFLLIIKKKDDAKHAFVFSASLLFWWVLLLMFFLLPIFTNIFEIIRQTGSTYQSINFSWMDAYNLNSAHLRDAFRLIGHWTFESFYKGYPYVYWSPAYKTSLFILIGFLLPIMTYSTFLFIKKQSYHTKKHLLFFGIITAFGLFIMMGALNPINFLFAKYIPFFATLFSLPYFFGGIFVVLGFSVLVGFSIAKLFNNSLTGIKSKCLKSISVTLAFLLIGVYGFPIWSGEFIYPGNRILGSARYSIPTYYHNARVWLDGQKDDFRIFALPYSKLGYMAYTWPPKGVNTSDPSPYLLNRAIITGTGFGLNFANKLAESNISGLSKLLGIMNVKYILIHNDANWEFIEDNSWYISPLSKFPKLALYNGGIYFEKSFGKLDLYKIPDEYFLPHIYPASGITLVQSSGAKEGGSDIELLPDILSMEDENIKSGIFFSSQNKERMEFIERVLGARRSTDSNGLRERILITENGVKRLFIKQDIKTPVIEFKKINPTKYRIRVHNATEDFPLVFSESFHKGWKAYLVEGGRLKVKSQDEILRQAQNDDFVSKIIKGTIQNNNLPDGGFYETWGKAPIPDDYHWVANGYANSWWIDLSQVCKVESGKSKSRCVQNPDGSIDFELVLEFWPQRLFYIGLFISGLTLITSVIYLIIPEKGKARGMEWVAQVRREPNKGFTTLLKPSIGPLLIKARTLLSRIMRCLSLPFHLSPNKGLLLWGTIFSAFLVLGIHDFFKGSSTENADYIITFSTIAIVVIYSYIFRRMRPWLERRYPRLREYLPEKPGAPYIAFAMALLLLCALLLIVQMEPVAEQVANLVYFLLVWGVVVEAKRAFRTPHTRE